MKARVCIAMLAISVALALPQVASAADSGAEYAKANLGIEPSSGAPALSGSYVGPVAGGSNHISFAGFATGDFCVVFSSPIGHAGLFDGALYRGSVYDYCMRSANTSPQNGVQLEQPAKYRNYRAAYGMWVVNSTATQRAKARDFCKSHNGQPYDITSAKTDWSRWYCSKLVWAAYRSVGGFDLDGTGGYWVSPADLYFDNDTRVFAQSVG